MNEDDARGPGGDFDAADGLDPEAVTAYIVDEIARALAAHERAQRGTVQRALPLGETLALFNLADQFGLIDDVRSDLDSRLGGDVYLTFSEAMKAAILDRGGAPGGGGGNRPGGPPGGNRPRPGQQGRPGQRGGRPPGGPKRGPR